ncbi:hypothetical protein L6452_00603 [Arctium lappa]|uniref:Uncharacterized protein n=1 Tax=Arctium lappa TaxID=4217 RepID=A0ACB9FFT1_ARCLA|nr:hypothetical protein L6452_00603 [Arctium lappa]
MAELRSNLTIGAIAEVKIKFGNVLIDLPTWFSSMIVSLESNVDLEVEMAAEGTTTQTNDGKNWVIYCTSLSWSGDGSTLFSGYTYGVWSPHIRSIFETQREVYNTTERISVSSFIASLLIRGYACIDHTDSASINLIAYQGSSWSVWLSNSIEIILIACE